MAGFRFGLPAIVIALGLVSFLSDVSSDLVYPLLPLFLSSVLHAGPVALGAIEGIAEATASLLKILSGILSDVIRSRLPMIAVGYALAAIARPLIGATTAWPQVLGLRFLDRIGKGVRTAPRDALIADAAPGERHGAAFGYQRALDNAGAMVGPLLAAALLQWAGLNLRTVFFIAAIPGILSVLVLLAAVRDKRAPLEVPPEEAPKPPKSGWAELGSAYKLYLLALLVFTLGGSSDAFLLLRLGNTGMSPAAIAVTWAAFHAVKTGTNFVGGRLTDRMGPRSPMILGWLLYAGVYVAFGEPLPVPALVAVFLLYGAYYGLTEPAESAWVARLASARRIGAAFGYFHGAVGLASLPASLVFGLLWQVFGAQAAFWTGAGLALAGALLLMRVPAQPRL